MHVLIYIAVYVIQFCTNVLAMNFLPFVFSTSLDLAITILSLTLDVQRHKHKARPVHHWKIA